MKGDRKELLKKWVMIVVPTLSLLLTCLMGPVAFTLKATVKDLVRQELAAYETTAASDNRWKAHQDCENEVLKRWEHDLAAVRDKATQSETNSFKLMTEVGNRLASIETKLDPVTKQHPREGKSQPGSGDP